MPHLIRQIVIPRVAAMPTANLQRAILPLGWDWGFGRVAIFLLGILGGCLELRAAPVPLAWNAEPGLRYLAVTPLPAANDKPVLESLPEVRTGIAFTNLLPVTRYGTNQILLNGSGVAAGDVDGDGWCDVFFCGMDRPNALYRNLGDWRFVDVAAEAGVRCEGLSSTGAALADFEGDGDLDLFVNSVGHGTRLFINDGHGKFALAGTFNLGKGGMSMALGDLNGDGYLDLYVANYRTSALMDMPNTRFHFATVDGRKVVARVNGRPATEPDLQNRYRVNERGGIEENGEVDEIFFNVAGGALQPVLFTSGSFRDEDGRTLTSAPYDWGLAVMIRDLNQDGRPDIWVCNDFDTPDRVWLGQGDGRFQAAPRLAFRKNSHFSMGVDVADFNRDGWDDVFVLDMLSRDHVQRMDMMGDRMPPNAPPGRIDNRPDYMINSLFLNRGDGTYAEVAQLAGLDATEWSWTPLFLDVDLDGFEDLLVANGNERAARSLDVAEQLRALRAGRQISADEVFENRKRFPRQNAPNLAFRNRGEGDLAFDDVSARWGFNYDGVSHGMALADLDNDGDLDVLVNNLNGPAGVYRNNAVGGRVAVRLKGMSPNTRGIGARITVRAHKLPVQSQEMICGGRYLSSDDPMRTFAAGAAMEISVDWPDGRRSVVASAKANRIYEIDQAGSSKVERIAPGPVRAWLTDASSLLRHTHHENVYDDFAQQTLLPQRFSQHGPGVTWVDVDGDERDDLVVGSGVGGALAVLRNTGAAFERIAGGAFDELVSRDQTAVLPVPAGNGKTRLLAGAARYEDGQTNGVQVRIYDVAMKAVRDLLPDGPGSAGPLAAADYDGDGRLDLLVGGRLIPGQYPAPASSQLWKGVENGFVLDAANAGAVSGVGLVSGAVFSDLDGDGDLDLVVACDWGALRILRNERGAFVEWNPPLASRSAGTNRTLADLRGLWAGVTTGDFDGDGRLDMVASNWGRNSRYEAYRSGPIELVYGDFDAGPGLEIVEAHYDSALRKVVPDRQLDVLARSMPFLKERFTSNVAFGRAGVDDLVRDRGTVHRVGVNWLESTVFLNRGDSFEVRVLPAAAQLAPAFGVSVGDFNGDGAQDLFLAQNFFATVPETPRHDAGLGLLLAGNGAGAFRALSATESGVRIYGEQRGAALADFDGDGHLDLAVAQNGAETKLYRNAGLGPAGLRVRLVGPAGNPSGVGATVRAVMGETLGAAVEVHAGSGYWSHDSSVVLLTAAKPVSAVRVRWPGGKESTTPVPAGAKSVRVSP